MSINALANAAATRRTDIVPIDEVPASLAQIARASATPPSTTGAPPAAASLEPKASAQIDTALHVLFGYIPTEILTLYVAVLAALQPATKPGDAPVPHVPTSSEHRAFWWFAAATPVVVWLTYATKVKAAGKPLPIAFRVVPVWEMIAGTVAYGAWALALPNAPFVGRSWYSPAVAGVAVLVASTVLGLLAPLFQRPLQATPASAS